MQVSAVGLRRTEGYHRESDIGQPGSSWPRLTGSSKGSLLCPLHFLSPPLRASGAPWTSREGVDGRRRVVCESLAQSAGRLAGLQSASHFWQEQVLHEMRRGVSVSLEQVLLIGDCTGAKTLCIRPPQQNGPARTALTHTHTHTNDNGVGGGMGARFNGSEDSSALGRFQLLVGQRMLNTH